MIEKYPYNHDFVLAKFFKPRPTRDINKIVIHISDGPARSIYQSVIYYSKNMEEWLKKSTHYFIGRGGEVIQMVKHSDIANHANEASKDSIGIEHIVSRHHTAPTPIQYEASARLVSWLCHQFLIPMDEYHIQGHNKASKITKHKQCPDKKWNWNHYRSILATQSCLPY